MKTNIKNVMVVGATGTLGSPIITALLNAEPPFTVSVLRREGSSESSMMPPKSDPSLFSSSVRVIHADYASQDALIAALKDQHAIISVVGYAGLSSQRALIDACLAEGSTVSRFVPSEFGNDTMGAENVLPELKMFMQPKEDILTYLRNVCSKLDSRLSYTGLATGPFMDWMFAQPGAPLGFSLTDSHATLFDGGEEPFTGTLLATIADAVVTILQHPEVTANKFYNIRSIETTQKKMVWALEQFNHSKIELRYDNTAEMMMAAHEALQKGDRLSARRGIFARQVFERSAGRGVIAKSAAEEEPGMKVLGVREVTEDEIIAAGYQYARHMEEAKKSVQ